MQVDREEFLRYLGWKGQKTDDTFLEKLDEAAKHCLSLATPRSVVRKFELTDALELKGTGFFSKERISAHTFRGAERSI